MKYLIILSMLMGCVANDYKAKNLDDSSLILEAKGQVGSRTLGLSDKKEIVLREESDAADELRVQQMVNIRLRDDLEYEYHHLKACRIAMSYPEMGGGGVFPENYDTGNLKPDLKAKEQIGLDGKKDLKIVKETYFLDELKIERKHTDSLKISIKTISKHKEECEYKLTIAKKRTVKTEVAHED